MEIYNLKNIRHWESRNGYGMIATLVINNIDVCTMTDNGDGSQPAFNILEPMLFRELSKKIDQLPELFIEQYGCDLKLDICMFIDLLHYSLETKTDFKLLAT
jgi:hypothetical protein